MSEIEPTKLIEALLQDSRAETMFKAGRKVDLNYFLQHPMYFEIYSSYFAKVNTESVDDYQSVIYHSKRYNHSFGKSLRMCKLVIFNALFALYLHFGM